MYRWPIFPGPQNKEKVLSFWSKTADSAGRLSLDGIKKAAEKWEHLAIPKPRVRKLRFYESMFTRSLEALTMRVEEECASHGVGTQSWRSGITDEIRFWWETISVISTSENSQSKFMLHGEFAWQDELVDHVGGIIDALDIGCAIRPNIGRFFPGRTVNVTAADPLASAYNTILDMFGIKREYTLGFAVAEKVADIFGTERFDFVLAENSIDHSYDPAAAFKQISKSLKKNGVARFEHFKNEALNQSYSGFHQWNLEPAGKTRVRVWNRKFDSIVDFSELGCSASVREYKRKRRGRDSCEAFDITVKKNL